VVVAEELNFSQATRQHGCLPLSQRIKDLEHELGQPLYERSTHNVSLTRLDYDIARFFADAEVIYSFEGTREMSTLIARKAITGESAFV
jgi:hypothetical protein